MFTLKIHPGPGEVYIAGGALALVTGRDTAPAQKLSLALFCTVAEARREICCNHVVHQP